MITSKYLYFSAFVFITLTLSVGSSCKVERRSDQAKSKLTIAADLSFPEKNKKWPKLEEVILVWKTHCDIGYTHPVPEVLDYYRNGMMDGALKLIEDTLNTPKDERFVWVLPAWVMEVILDEKQTPERRQRIEKAIRSGRIVWHALPYTFESDAGDLEELVRGLGSGTRLAKKFGQPLPADSKLTDVPSQSWVLPTLLANAGVRFIHIGVNPWSPNPIVPNLFWWEGPDGSRVLTGYSFHNYGWDPLPPEGWQYKTWLCLQVTGDNSGPPTPEVVKGVLDKLHKELPGVRIRFGRPSDFADAIIKEKNSNIPVIRADMPDTWTHGQMSMPVPTKTHRQAAPALISLGLLSTELKAWNVPENDITGLLSSAYMQGGLYTEHTWGIAGPAFGSPDHKTWVNNLASGKYKDQLATFNWHAEYAYKAMKLAEDGISDRMRGLAKAIRCNGQRIVVFNALPWSRDGVVSIEIPKDEDLPVSVRDLENGKETPVTKSGRTITFNVANIPPGGYRSYSCVSGKTVSVKSIQTETLETAYFRVKFDTKRGGIKSIINKKDGREMANTETHALGQFIHERFSKKEVDAFLKAYCNVYYTWFGFPYYDFNKPMLDSAISYKCISPEDWSLSILRDANGYQAIMTTRNTEGLADGYSLNFFFPDNQPYIEITWSVNGKKPELIPEGGWISLPLNIKSPSFRVSHVGAPFSPEKDLIAGVNRHLFSIDNGISVRDSYSGSGIGVASSDLPLWSIGESGLWKYSIDYVPRKAELFANLYNNQWNTNYPLWTDGTWNASLRLWPIDNGTSEETALFTPAWEYRQGLLCGFANGSPGSLAPSQTGLSLSRKGIRVTAFCPNPDGDHGIPGILVRVWEQAGLQGEVMLTLPSGFRVVKAQPVNLRGEKAGNPIEIQQGNIKFNLKAYSPASFVLN